MTPIERDNQVKVIKDVVGKIDPNLKELQKFFKNNFNQGIIKIGDHAIYDLNTIFYTSSQIKNTCMIQTQFYKNLQLIKIMLFMQGFQIPSNLMIYKTKQN